MSKQSKDQVSLKLTNGENLRFAQTSKDLKGLYFKSILKDLNEQVPFEYILINETESQKQVSKMNDILEFGMCYELHDARGLLKFYRDQKKQIQISKTKALNEQVEENSNLKKIIKDLQQTQEENLKQLDENKNQMTLIQQKYDAQSQVITQREVEIQKLQETQVKVDDESKKQMALLQQQSDSAMVQKKQEIQKMNENLKEINQKYSNEIKEIQKSNTLAEWDYHELAKRMIKEKEVVRNLKDKNQQKDEECRLLETKIKEIQTEKSLIQQNCDELSQRLNSSKDNLMQEIGKLKQLTQELKNQNQQLAEQFQLTSNKLQHENQEHGALRTQYNQVQILLKEALQKQQEYCQNINNLQQYNQQFQQTQTELYSHIGQQNLQIQQQDQKIQDLNQKINNLNKEKQQNTTEIENLTYQIKTLKSKITELSDEIEELETKLQKSIKNYQLKEEELEQSTHQIQKQKLLMNQNQDQFDKQIQDYKHQIKEFETQNLQLQRNLQKMKDEQQILQINNLNTNQRDIQKELQDAQKQYQALLDEKLKIITQLKNQIEHQEEDNQKNQKCITEQKDQIQKLQMQIEKLESQNEIQERGFTDVQGNLEQKNNIIKNLKAQIEELIMFQQNLEKKVNNYLLTENGYKSEIENIKEQQIQQLKKHQEQVTALDLQLIEKQQKLEQEIKTQASVDYLRFRITRLVENQKVKYYFGLKHAFQQLMEETPYDIKEFTDHAEHKNIEFTISRIIPKMEKLNTKLYHPSDLNFSECFELQEIGKISGKMANQSSANADLDRIILFKSEQCNDQPDFQNKIFGIKSYKQADDEDIFNQDQVIAYGAAPIISQVLLQKYYDDLNKAKAENIIEGFKFQEQYVLSRMGEKLEYYQAQVLDQAENNFKCNGGHMKLRTKENGPFFNAFSYFTTHVTQNQLAVTHIQGINKQLFDPLVSSYDGFLDKMDQGFNEINTYQSIYRYAKIEAKGLPYLNALEIHPI